MIKKKPTAKVLLLLIFAFIALIIISAKVLEAASSAAPNFPNCEDKIFASNGDRAHYDFGIHGIPGVGDREGRDDVYTLANGNFLQCYCPVEGNNGLPAQAGIQSNWWNVRDLNSGERSEFASQGWMTVTNGSGWGLTDDPFLVKNRDFSCSPPASTPTQTVTPTISPVPTIAPITTSTPGPNGPESRCFDLEASPIEGTVPLTVRFFGHADDPASGGKIKEYRFDFADNSGNQPQVVSQTDRTAYHRYELSGTYKAKLKVQDNAGNWRESGDCEAEIKVSAAPQVLGAASPEVLPATGFPAVLGLLGLVLIPIGIYLYRRFRLV